MFDFLWRKNGSGAGSRLAPAPRKRRLAVEPLEGRALLAAMADLVAFRPVNTYIDYLQHTVAESLEEDPTRGAGIRVNGDDDNRDGRADFLEATTAASGDNDLVRVDVRGAGDALTVTWSGSLAVWTSATKASPVVNGGAVAAGQSLWVEYVSSVHTVGVGTALSLTSRETATNSAAEDRVVFHSFQSVVLAIGGNSQNPRDFGDPRLGIFVIGGSLYDRGYDVQLFAHDQVQSTGRGAAYDEVTAAVLLRNVDQVALIGYSWGGGAVQELAAGLAGNAALAPAGYRLQYTAYVDGIRHGAVTSETRLPARTAYHHNFYQRKDWLLKGNSVTGAVNVNVTQTSWGKALTHTTLDDHSQLQQELLARLTSRVIV